MIGLPEINALLNATATILIVMGLIAIKQERKDLHRMLMASAFLVSILFLGFYVANRVLMKGVHTPFGGEGAWQIFYYILLASHVLLAMSVPFLAIRTIALGIQGSYEKHKKWARLTYPIWLYVSVTGVLVYFFLYQWF